MAKLDYHSDPEVMFTTARPWASIIIAIVGVMLAAYGVWAGQICAAAFGLLLPVSLLMTADYDVYLISRPQRLLIVEQKHLGRLHRRDEYDLNLIERFELESMEPGAVDRRIVAVLKTGARQPLCGDFTEGGGSLRAVERLNTALKEVCPPN
jgi:hypothetical protein